MPGVVPLDDLPDSLRGTAVPADDLPDAPAPAARGPRTVTSLGDIVPGEAEGRDYVLAPRAPTTPQAPERSVADRALGVADNILPALTSIPAEIAASGTRLFGGGPGAQQFARNLFQTQPFTDQGREVA